MCMTLEIIRKPRQQPVYNIAYGFYNPFMKTINGITESLNNNYGRLGTATYNLV